MLFLERYMKNLKGLVWQMTKLEGSMAEGYIVYESFYFSSEYIKNIDDSLGEMVWEDQLGEEKREGEPLQMNVKMCMIKSNPLIFCQIICIIDFFTLKLIIYIWSHIIFLEFLYMLANQNMMTSINLLFTMRRQQNHGSHWWREKKEMGQL